MHRTLRALVAALATLAAAPTWATPPELRIGLAVDNPPWAYAPERLPQLLAGETAMPAITPAQLRSLAGFEIDVAALLCRQMGVTPRFVPTDWAALEQQLLEGRFDVILSAWTPSRRTPPDVVASEPYATWGLVVTVRADSKVGGYADLARAAVVGHYSDPAVERTLRSLGLAQTRSYDSEGTLFRDLKLGVLDAVVHDSTYARWRVKADPSLRIAGEPLNRMGYHVGVRRQDAELLAKVQAALKQIGPQVEGLRATWETARRPPEAPVR